MLATPVSICIKLKLKVFIPRSFNSNSTMDLDEAIAALGSITDDYIAEKRQKRNGKTLI